MQLLLLLIVLAAPISVGYADNNENINELCNSFYINTRDDTHEFEKSVAVRVFNRELAIPDGFIINEYKDGYVLFLRHQDIPSPSGSIRVGNFKESDSIDQYLETHAETTCNVHDSDLRITLEKDYFGEFKNAVYTVRVYDDREFIVVISNSLELWSEFVSLQGSLLSNSKRSPD